MILYENHITKLLVTELRSSPLKKTLAVKKRKLENSAGSCGNQTSDLCAIGAVLYQMSCQKNLEQVIFLAHIKPLKDEI